MINELINKLDSELMEFYQTHPEHSNPFLWEVRENMLAESCAPSQLEANTFALFEEIASLRHGYDRDEESVKKPYRFVLDEIYRFLKNDEYHEDRINLGVVKDMVIPMIAVKLSQIAGVDPVLAVAAVTFLFSTVLKIGIGAWCSYYEDTYLKEKK